MGNGLRRTLAAGAAGLPADQQALLAGLVVGDDRAQSPVVSDQFEAAGLVHLLAVSGQNVAFVLVLAAPLLSRLGLRARLVATLAVLGFFGLVTRFEPSVLRATAMAGVATLAATVGREASSLRLLALAVTAVLIVDPLLIGAVGFQLSVGASLGIVVLSGPLVRRLPLPGWLARPLAVTLAAQVGVAPVLVPVFGGVPVASIPANLLAVPAAGPVMMWGLTGGVLAGVAVHVPGGRAGELIAAALHVPTRVLLGWIAGVARAFAHAPLGELGPIHLTVMVAGILVVSAGRRLPALARWRARLAVAAVLAVVAAVSAPVVMAVMPSPPPLQQTAAGLAVWRRGDVVMVTVGGTGSPGAALEALRRAGVRHIDVVVVESAGAPAGRVAGALLDRFAPAVVLAPAASRVPGATVPDTDVAFTIGGSDGLDLTVVVESGALDTLVAPAGRGPPPGAPSSGG